MREILWNFENASFKSYSVKTKGANYPWLTSTRFCPFCAAWTHQKLHRGNLWALHNPLNMPLPAFSVQARMTAFILQTHAHQHSAWLKPAPRVSSLVLFISESQKTLYVPTHPLSLNKCNGSELSNVANSLLKNCSGETIHWLIACGGRVGHYSILRTLCQDCDLKHNGKLVALW